MNAVRTTIIATAMLASVAAGGCGSENGNLAVVVSAEETIPKGLQAGDGDEEIRDGFSVSFSRYIVVVGQVAMSQAGDANPQESSDVAVADFVTLPSTPPELTTFNDIPTGQYTSFGFETPAPDQGVMNLNDVDQDDIDAMVAGGLSYIIEGTITQVSDEATKDFLIEADVPSVYTNCAVEDGEPGVNVASNSTADITIHGDHIFFNGFPEEEGNVVRLAQWMWDVEDVNADEVLTKADFEEASNVETLFPSPPNGVYELAGAPIDQINNAWDFIRAQLATQGHILGEGECEPSDI